MTPPPGPVCVLVGIMGAGKTTVGQLVAERLGVAFRDVDEVIVAAAGKPVADIFVDDGEEVFRAMERATVAAQLAEFDGVLALGGGAVMAEETRNRLRDQVVVFLSVDFADAVNRVGLGVGRPLLALNPRATMRHLLEQRRPLYEQVASLTVKTDGRNPADIAGEIVRVLRPGPGDGGAGR